MIVFSCVLLLFLIAYFLGGHIYTKFVIYDSWYALDMDFLKVLLLALLALFVADDKVESLVYLVPILVAALFVGLIRLTILAFLVFVGYALQSSSKLKRSLLFFVLLYYTGNAVVFLGNVVRYGDGFSRSPVFFSSLLGWFF